METITEIKKFLRDNCEKGTRCPCCNQTVKLYKRKFNAGMAKALIYIYLISEKNNNGWIHIQNEFATKYKINANHFDYSQLEKWKLIERKIGERRDGSKSVGMWRITEKGIDFAHGRIKIPHIVSIYDNKIYGYSGKEINILEVYKDQFNYNELMGIQKPYSGEPQIN